ncbi:MAG: DNA translocase FtsK 4TM domain-containing protein [Acidobacteriota bacterium]|jgi:S-DNA-T family DNA segregation ATPase FtsK/SpoIIIE
MGRSREEVAREVAGYIVLVAALVVAVALLSYHPLDPSWFAAGSDDVHNLLGRFGAVLAGILVTLFGVLALIVPVLLGVVGWQWLKGRQLEWPALQAGAWLAFVAFTGALLVDGVGRTPYRGGELAWGGEIGRLVAVGLSESVGLVGTVIISAAGALAGAVLGLKGSLRATFERLGEQLAASRARTAARLAQWREARRRKKLRRELVQRHLAKLPRRRSPPVIARQVDGPATFRIRRVARVQVTHEEDERVEDVGEQGDRQPPPRREAAPRVEVVPVQSTFAFVTENAISRLPEKTMLLPAPPFTPPDAAQLATMRELVEARCREFKVEGRVEEVLPGPVITTYEFRPAAGVKYAQIVALEEDLALGLQVEAVRVERILGKASVGIEVPNPTRQTIVLKEIIEASKFVHSASPLTLALGKDIHGRPFVADLQRMPHLLIGGFTGSGKSVGINAMIMSILFKATPEEVRFILIDPKMVELGMYEKLPHLLTPIISDPRQAARALRWAVREMRERYQLLASCKVRNLAQYNSLIADPEARRQVQQLADGADLKPLPFIVVIIDELADLMMTCAKEVEDSIGHLSQMARAVGIHLIFATQRPSVDIITGVIKANFPCRIAYKVRTRFDSRTILDSEGAECLLGMGDMLFLPAGASRPMRLHGCLVREEEILTVLKHLRKLGKPEFDPRVLEEPEAGADDNGGLPADDPMYEQAARLVVASRKASASYIQRKLRLGYSRSARLLDLMEHEGLVGPAQGSRGREVLVPPDYFGEVDATHTLDDE